MSGIIRSEDTKLRSMQKIKKAKFVGRVQKILEYMKNEMSMKMER